METVEPVKPLFLKCLPYGRCRETTRLLAAQALETAVLRQSCYSTLLLSDALTQYLCVSTDLHSRVITAPLLKLLLCCTKLCTLSLQDIPKGFSNTFQSHPRHMYSHTPEHLSHICRIFSPKFMFPFTKC